MSFKDRLRALVSKGYFPSELPPVFTTSTFGQHVSDILEEWRAAGLFHVKSAGKVPSTGKAKRHAYIYDIDAAELEIISKPKLGYERRNIHITHPLPQSLLSYEVTSNWVVIQRWLSRQAFSLDEIRISERYERALKGVNFRLHTTKKAYLEATADWLVKTDISRFYPTIYTHSIAWAAYGKERVKKNIRLYRGSLADRLDILIRSCNRDQTVGIPIGPETSRIIAEIISSRIDANFSKKVTDVPAECVDRRQDDWLVGVNTLEEAERVLSIITSIYRDYGLEINGTKTSIEHILATSETAWIAEIGAFLSHRSDALRGARLKELLSLGLRLQSQFLNDPVINYVLAIIENQPVASGDVQLLESFLMKASVLSPISMNHICRIMLNLRYTTRQISRQRVGDRFLALAMRNLENGNFYEVMWLVYTLRGLRVQLHSKRLAELIEQTTSSALALILLDMKNKGLCLCRLPEAKWVSQITEENVRTEWIWLVAYEGIRRGWLPDPKNVLAGPLFQPMASRDVCFYDPAKNVPRSKRVVERRNRSRKRQTREVQRLLRALRGVKVGEY